MTSARRLEVLDYRNREAIRSLDALDPPEERPRPSRCECFPCWICKGKPSEPTEYSREVEWAEMLTFTCYHGEDDPVCKCPKCVKCGASVDRAYIRATQPGFDDVYCKRDFVRVFSWQYRLYWKVGAWMEKWVKGGRQ